MNDAASAALAPQLQRQRVANVPQHPPPSTRLMSCARIANRQLPRIIGASAVLLTVGLVLWSCQLARAAGSAEELLRWPAPGSEDTELGVLMELEVGHGETEVYPRVQA
jgi:hypothetical protein